jgi:hypothetical protein
VQPITVWEYRWSESHVCDSWQHYRDALWRILHLYCRVCTQYSNSFKLL